MYNEEQALRKISNTKTKHIIIAVIITCIILMILLGVLLVVYIRSLPLVKVPVVSLSTTEWTSESVTVKVENDASKISEYSFDGGYSFQESPLYIISKNGEVVVQVKDKNGKLSKKNVISVNNIDREPPTMAFESITYVQMGSIFSPKTGVQVTDSGSGLNNNYTVTPATIDTSAEGEYVLTYSAFDNAGNFVEKNRTIIIRDIKGRTYYRYRKGVVQTAQCEPYLCNCVSSYSAIETGTCPTGYKMNENKQCCQTCYKTCNNITWGEWSEWQQEKVQANATTEVETMIKED